MELDELRKQLNQFMSPPGEERSVGDIASLLKRESVSVIHKLKRSLCIEIFFCACFVVISVYIMLTQSQAYAVLFAVAGSVAIMFIIILTSLLKKINRLLQNIPVKENLQRIIIIMNGYVKHYLQLTVFLLPLFFAGGLWLSYNDPEKILRPMSVQFFILLAIIMLIIGSGIYFFTKWYLKKLYGNYLAQVKSLLQEIEE